MTKKKRDANCWSQLWSRFDEISEDDRKEIEFVACTLCDAIVYKPNSNTNPMRRHTCSGVQAMTKQANRVCVQKSDKTSLKVAAAKFCSKDLRPTYAVELEGLLDLCTECMHFGQNHPKATREDLAIAMPSRNTVSNAIEDIAKRNRAKIGNLMKEAIANGGLAATVDGWRDDFRKLCYQAVVVHLLIHNGTVIKQHRFVLSTNEVTEMVKTGIN